MNSNTSHNTSLSSISQAAQLFPIGAARSGTTILAKLLNAHPQILVTSETSVFLQLSSIINKSQMGVKSGILFGKQYHELWSDHLREHTKELIESYYAKIISLNEKKDVKYWGDKHPHHHSCLEFIESLYPKAKYIYITRDPRDVACSIAKMNSITFTQALKTWKQFAIKYEEFFTKHTTEKIYQIRYEDLVSNYEKTIKEVFTWLKIDFHIKTKEFIENYKNIDSHSYQYMPITSPGMKKLDFGMKSIGRWKQETTHQEQEDALQTIAEYLNKYKYI